MNSRPKTAIVMAGAGLHGRMLVEAMAGAGFAPDLIVLESGTARAARIANFLANDTDNPPPLPAILAGTPTRVFETDDFHGPDALAALDAAAPDYIVNGGAGIYKPSILGLARRHFLNAHPGLLPEYRGLDPVPWTLVEAGSLGATLHIVTPGLDDGDILIRRVANGLHAPSVLALRLKMLRLCAELVVEYFRDPDRWPPSPQDAASARNRGAFPADRMTEAEAALARRNDRATFQE
jgi:methionyl-tRNA formyltransferase